MEPTTTPTTILTTLLAHALACGWFAVATTHRFTVQAHRWYLATKAQPSPGAPQLDAVIDAWATAAAAGDWSEPDPADVPSLIGSGWDSWSCGDHWLDEQQIDELPDDLPLDWAT